MFEKNSYQSILYEGKSLIFLKKILPQIFPKVFFYNNNLIVMDFIKFNKIKDSNSEKNLAVHLSNIHKINNNKYGFDFDAPIGGMRQPAKYEESWIKFYEKNRLGMIFEEINSTKPMPKKINKGIEKILKNLNNYIPDSPKPSLMHGDLWEGNIFFNNGKLKCLIDPGPFYGHNEMEISYLKWFKYISNNFYDYYSEYIQIDKEFKNYSEIYEIYFSLLNVHLWSREYIKDVGLLISKYL